MADDPASVLESRQAELEAELAALSTPMGDQGGISFGKRVGEGTSVAVERLSQVAAHGRLQAMLGEVTRARLKVADGTYETCDSCGNPIGAERLQALPWATRCMLCASRT